MAIVGTNLTTNGSTANASSYTTASITPTANSLVLAAVNTGLGALAPTLAGNSLTWVQVGTIRNPGNNLRTTVFRAMGASPTTGTVVISIGTQTRATWSIVEFSGIDTGGTDGSAAVVQFKTAADDTGTAATADFDDAFGDAVNNATFSAIGTASNSAITAEGGYTEIGNSALFEGYNVETMYKVGEDQTPVPTWGTSGPWAQVIVEIKAAAVGTAVPSRMMTMGVG